MHEDFIFRPGLQIFSRHLLTTTLSASLLQPTIVYAEDTDIRNQPHVPSAPVTQEAAGELRPVLVVGARGALPSAQEIKRESSGIVDAVVAEDIGKLPDYSVAEALLRLPGVQAQRDRGEATGITIRGLDQITTTLNGREIFTAGLSRILDAADIPAELLRDITIHKTSSAAQLEGGLGGTVDLRTYRPFDFADRVVAASARVTGGDLVRKAEPQFSLLASDRGHLGEVGEFGALFNVSRQRRAWREDQQGTGQPVPRTDLLPGQTVYAPGGSANTISAGQRERTTASLALQWRPVRQLELYTEGTYAELLTRQDSYQLNMLQPATFAAGSATLFPGTPNLRSVTWTGAPVSILSFARDTANRDGQAAIGGTWTGRSLTLSADASYARSSSQLLFSGIGLGATAPTFRQDFAANPPGAAITGVDLADPANLRVTDVLYRYQRFEGSLAALRLDGDYQLTDSVLRSLSSGVRFANRLASNAPGLLVADAPVGGTSATSLPGLLVASRYRDYFAGQGTMRFDGVLAGDPTLERDPLALRNAFGVTTPIPAAASAVSIWNLREETQAAYLMANFKSKRQPLDGNLGLRAVRTHEMSFGAGTLPNGTTVPMRRDEVRTDFLPSASVRYAAADNLVLRAAASRTTARPDFNQLSPSLTLLRNTIDPSLNRGMAGNPALQPVRGNNVDVAIEHYAGPGTTLSLTGFSKWLNGFAATVNTPEVHDGVTYLVSRPRNTGTARVQGFEVSWQQLFDFLPGWWRGFGVQANYTYIDSRAEGGSVGITLPLQGVSPHTVNVTGLYESKYMTTRLAYSWRDRFVSGVASLAGIGVVPVYTAGYGWLDASLLYRVNRNTSIGVEGKNLLRTARRSYYGTPDRPQNNWINDIQLSLVAAFRF
ncbi:TonB-dependent receptor [Cupriavidus sp. UYPR2.512]|uniref:TonB-dependent receptor n=1 Tax=Cupriavidus sp. UYPR2.512 TaxID=1080187 RepID=UPI0012FAE34C|nr:TonB-dependent receptor [Cupriavidus sp. UYPR2.512]UIF88159.1 TonB-dependent receptor [Cupriavidus necator]